MQPSDRTVVQQKIFKMNLSVEEISLYLLMCSLVESGLAVSLNRIKSRWNGSDSELFNSLAVLEEKGIVRLFLSEGTNRIYSIEAPERWIES